MTPLFRKLNLKAQRTILVLDAPASFEAELAALEGVRVLRDATSASTTFGIGFAVTDSALDRVSSALVAASEGDAIVWIAYPKASSKRHRCEFNRDGGWRVMADAGFEAVRQVAIDEDWSALRFRRVEYIPTLARAPERAATAAGRARTAR